MNIQAIRGMKDVLPPEISLWRFVEDTARDIFGNFGFAELRAPILEKTELFARAIGQATDIVEKEMYTFTDLSGDSLTLRPEATAGVLRAYVEHKIYTQPGPHRFFSIGPMFRHERPQKGRYRQFHQLNAEVLGDDGPQTDAELIIMLLHLMDKLRLPNVTLLLNSLGCPQCRPLYRQALVAYLTERRAGLCADCLRRLELNPLRVLDCKLESCRAITRDAPLMPDYLCSACRDHFGAVKDLLALAGVEYALTPTLVRGLDYYVRTTFEVVCGDLGAQNAVAGGGRYDGLIESLGGPAQGGLGFACGLERLVLLLGDVSLSSAGPQLFVAALGQTARQRAFGLVHNLRRQGFWAEMMTEDKSLKAQMKRADKIKALQVLIVGDEELANNRAVLKNMRTSEQTEIALDQLEMIFAGQKGE